VQQQQKQQRLGRACFSRKISRKMALFFAEQNAAKNGTFFREAKNGEKLYFSRCEMRRNLVQIGAKIGENGALSLAKNGEKWRFPKEI
jgi:hypothetical protein